MLTGRTNGTYAYHYEFRGNQRTPVPGGRRVEFAIPLDLPAGYWFVTITSTFGLRNLNVLTSVLPINPDLRGNGGIHNHTDSPAFGPVTVVSHWDNLRVQAGVPATLRVVCMAAGPRSAGELGESAFSVVAWKQTGVSRSGVPSMAVATPSNAHQPTAPARTETAAKSKPRARR